MTSERGDERGEGEKIMGRAGCLAGLGARDHGREMVERVMEQRRLLMKGRAAEQMECMDECGLKKRCVW